MKHKLVFLSVILLAADINGMKRKRPKNTLSAYSPKRKQSQVTNFVSLPEDIQNIIIYFSTNNSTAISPIIAMKTIRSLAETNRQFNTLINEPTFSDNLIKDLAKKYSRSHELIAEMLHTKTATQRLLLQMELKKLCCSEDIKLNQKRELNELIDRGVNLDFIFNYHKHEIKCDRTILMMAAKSNISFFGYLIKKSINPNACNLSGLTALHVVVEYPIIEHVLGLLINCQHLIINQQNNHGETPLLWSIINRENFPINNAFLNTVKKLLLHGADPELGNNDNLTPLAAAENLENQEIIDIIKEAIAKKHATKN